MTKVLRILVLFLLCINSITWAENIAIKDNNTINIGGDNYFPPFEYVDSNGNYKGFNVDIIRAIALETGMDIEFYPMTWYEVGAALETGIIDVAQGMKHSEEREEIYSFSDPYIVTSLSIFVQMDSASIINLEDLKGKRVAVQKNDIAYNLLKESNEVIIVETENQTNALDKVVKGEVDAYLGNRLVGLYSIQKKGYQKQIKMSGGLILPENYGFALKKGNKELLQQLNEGLGIIKKNGTYDRIYEKWFGEEVKPPLAYFKSILMILGIVAIGIVFVVVIVVRINFHLKKEVEKRTADLKRETLYKAQIIDSIFSGLITFDINLEIKSINNKVNSILHTENNDLLGLHLKETNLIPFLSEEEFTEMFRNKIARIDIEKHCQIKKQDRTIEYNISPIFNCKAELVGYTVTFRDVTHERQMLKRAMRNEKLESLGRLTAGIAHEIRNPLASIRTYLDILPEKYDDSRFRSRISKDVPEVIDKLNDSINSLLDFAKPRDTYPSYFSISEAVDNTYGLMSKEIENAGIKVAIELSYDDYVFMDKQHLGQVILNLLINAIDAVKDTEAPYITIKSTRIKEYSVLDIQDNGYGIPKEQIENIFDPFYTTKDNGTGLGLAISHQLINQNGGEIQLKNDQKTGTCFRICLPYSAGKQ